MTKEAKPGCDCDLCRGLRERDAAIEAKRRVMGDCAERTFALEKELDQVKNMCAAFSLELRAAVDVLRDVVGGLNEYGIWACSPLKANATAIVAAYDAKHPEGA